LNWRAALLSALCAALSVWVTFLTARRLLRLHRHALLWAGLAAFAWAVAPLLWMQAVITEVYALHSLLLALLGWAVLVHPDKLWYVVIPVALGIANHLTFILLLPAAFYILWTEGNRQSDRQRDERWRGLLPVGAAFMLGIALGALLYLRIPLVAAGTPPVNWGYADNWNGFLWLVSGAAYRAYLFASPAGSLLTRLAGWAYTVTAQFTPVGLALALIGLAYWDRTAGHLRNFSLLWLAPISVYALAYYTRDSDIYLLPVGWIMAIWLAVGLLQVDDWVSQRFAQRFVLAQPTRTTAGMLLAGLVSLGLLGITAWRWNGISLANDREARDYLQQVTAVLEPGSIVVTLADRETFALWFGAWGSGELAAVAPGVTPINESLYQFDWYRRLQGELHPTIRGIDQSVDAVVAANRGQRPIYFAQIPQNIARTDVTQIGPLWRLNE
jgi:hypothetical protein